MTLGKHSLRLLPTDTDTHTHTHTQHPWLPWGSHTQEEVPHPTSCLRSLSAYLHLYHRTPSLLYLLQILIHSKMVLHNEGNRVEAARSTEQGVQNLTCNPFLAVPVTASVCPEEDFAPPWALVSPNTFCLDSRFVTWYCGFPGLGGLLRPHCHLIPTVLELLREAEDVSTNPTCLTDQKHLPQRPIPASSPSESLFWAFWRHELTEHTQYN